MAFTDSQRQWITETVMRAKGTVEQDADADGNFPVFRIVDVPDEVQPDDVVNEAVAQLRADGILASNVGGGTIKIDPPVRR